MKIRFPYIGRLSLALAVGLLLTGLPGCVYYNTFYNAKRYFREGVKENENNDTGRPKTANYQKAIDSAARILEYYPKSKYMDDALLIMGKAYYEIRTFPKAKKKFDELLTLYPNSELKSEAQLWLAKTLIATGQSDQGLEILTTLWTEEAADEVRLESQLRLADYHFEKKNYRQALLEYEKFLENAKDKKQRADAWYQVGECRFNLNEFDEAEKAYQKVLNEKPSRKREFEAIFRGVSTLRQRGELEPALKICEDLLKKQIYFAYIDQVYLAKGEILTELDRHGEAEEIFKRILELYPRTDTSAKASYLLGKIYLEQVKDFEKAEEYLTRVQTEKAGTDVSLQAQNLVNDLRFLKSLNTQIDSLGIEIDTLNYRLHWLGDHPGEPFPQESAQSARPAQFADTLGVGQAPSLLDSLRGLHRPDALARQQMEQLPGYIPGRERFEEGLPPGQEMPTSRPSAPALRGMALLPTDSTGIMDRMADDEEGLADLRFRLAEHLWMQFGDVDSAQAIFTELGRLENYPDIAARSLLSKYHLLAAASPDSTGPDSLLQAVHDHFPDTEFDRWVRPLLGLEPLPEPVDSAASLFLQAENSWMEDKQTESAVKQYQEVTKLYPASPWGAKALFASAWLQEHVLRNVPSALASYDSLIARYPDSPYYAIAQLKVAAPPEEILDTTGVAQDTTVIAPEIVDFGAAPATGSGPPQLVGGESVLEDFIHKNHLYPQVALEANLPGEAMVTFVVDAHGSPRDFNIVNETPEGFDFGAMAVQALQEMKFRPGFAQGQFVESPMTQLVRFNP